MAKKWFISGASRGIGFAVTQQLLAAGHQVYATARHTTSLHTLQKHYPDHLVVAAMDVCDLAQIHSVTQACLSAWGSIDVLLSNAGYGIFGAVEECSDEEIVRLMDTNVRGSWRLIKAFLPSMRSARHGHIIQLSSVAGQTAYPGLSIYNMSKWAVEGLCDGLSKEVANFGIKVTMIEPGAVATDFFSVEKSAQATTPIEAYRQETPIGALLAQLQELDAFIAHGTPRAERVTADGQRVPPPPPSDVQKVAREIIAVSLREDPPLRLAMGSEAYKSLQAQWQARLENLVHYRSVTCSTDMDVPA